ncbi:hypothetical protein EDD29_0476 [Actinocorallia herbida]|uniref:Uncharacterized protein n=1 Tax=Actinocorallia herbida TaxID=58109 RepID=A0A3N1CQH4_9ACTN|nr:hypothetical protein [Actinocorallia herbida]ROO82988.1 hypothetical protein EDD29_0476 [Actinocorallia herbida]
MSGTRNPVPSRGARTVRRAAAAFVVVLLALPLAPAFAEGVIPPHATARWERIAEALRDDPLFVDTDLADAMPGPMRRELRAEMKTAAEALKTDVYFIAVPDPNESETEGNASLLLAGVYDEFRKDGLYLMVDQDGDLEGRDYGVPRDFGYQVVAYEDRNAADYERPFADLLGRVETVLTAAAALPAGEPRLPDGPPDLPSFAEDEPFGPEPEIAGPFFAGLLILGPLLVLVLWGFWAAAKGLWAGRGEAKAKASWRTKPSLGRLRTTSRKELRTLAEGLDKAGDTTGAATAMRAYDAALLVADEARRGTDPAVEALDLLGVIVLCRQGTLALAQDLSRGPLFCQVNPLHGLGTRARTSADAGHPPGQVCAVCAGLSRSRVRTAILRVPDGRPYPEVESLWRTGFGGRPDLAARVLESLGVR